MATASRSKVGWTTRHGTISFVAGFLAGLALFLAVGAPADDAIFSATVAAALVTTLRFLPQ